MSALDAFPSERQHLGYSDAYGVSTTERYQSLLRETPEPLGVPQEMTLSVYRWQATLSERIAAWRILSASEGIGRYGSTVTAPKETR